MAPASLADCPPELVLRILCRLSLQDLHACQLINKFYNTLIKNSVLLTYIMELQAAGYLNEPNSTVSSTFDRLRALSTHEDNFLRLQYKLREAVDFPLTSNASRVYDLCGNFFVVGSSSLEPGGTTELKLHRLDTPGEAQEATSVTPMAMDGEEEPVVQETGPWFTIGRGTEPIFDFGTCITEHNLIAIVRKTQDPTLDAEITLLRVPDGEPHPLAMKSTLTVPKQSWQAPPPTGMPGPLLQQLQQLTNLLPGLPPFPGLPIPGNNPVPPVAAQAAPTVGANQPQPPAGPAPPPAALPVLQGLQPQLQAFQAQTQVALAQLINAIGAAPGAPFGGFQVANPQLGQPAQTPAQPVVQPGQGLAAGQNVPGFNFGGPPAAGGPQGAPQFFFGPPPPPNAGAAPQPPALQFNFAPPPNLPVAAGGPAPGIPQIPGFGGIQFVMGPPLPLGGPGGPLPPVGPPMPFVLGPPGQGPAGPGGIPGGILFNIQVGMAPVGGSRPVICLEIVGDVLALLYNCRSRPDRFMAWNWKTGDLLFSVEAPPSTYVSVVFLEEDIVCLPNMETNCIEIYKIPIDKDTPPPPPSNIHDDDPKWTTKKFNSRFTFDRTYGPDSIADLDDIPPPEWDTPYSPTPSVGAGPTDPAPLPPVKTTYPASHPRLMCCLALPAIAEGGSMQSLSARSSPNPVGRTSKRNPDGIRTAEERPFRLDPADAIVTFAMQVIPPRAIMTYAFSFVVHRKALLSYVKDEPVAPIPWEEWGTTRTRWFNSDILSRNWITVSDGQRYTFVPNNPEEPNRRQYAYTMDFNQYKVKKLLAAKRAASPGVEVKTEKRSGDVQPEDVPIGIEDDADDWAEVDEGSIFNFNAAPGQPRPQRPVSQLLGLGPLKDVTPLHVDPQLPPVQCGQHAIALRTSGVFADRVVSELPFILSRTKEDYVWNSTIMDSNHVVGMHITPEGVQQLNILHIG